MLDPYREWLGISDERRPPTLYQLLGLPPGTSDPRLIEAAVARQLAKVQSHIAGSYSKDAWRIIDEITLAKTTLLDPAKRAGYDAIFGTGAAKPKASKPGPVITVSTTASGWEQQGNPFPTNPLPSAPFPGTPLPTPPFPTAQGPVGPFPTAPFPPGQAPVSPFPTAPFPTAAGQSAPFPPGPMPTFSPPPPPTMGAMPGQQPAFPLPRQAAPIAAAPPANFLEDDDGFRDHDDPSSQGLPTTDDVIPKRRGKGGGGSGMIMVVGILVLGLIGGGIYFATRDKQSSGSGNEVADNSDPKKLKNPVPIDPETKSVDKKKDPIKDKKNDTPIQKKKTPPKPPDPPPPIETVAEFKETKVLRGHEGTARAVAVSPDGKLLLTAGDDMAVFTWSPSGDKGSRRKNLASPAIGVGFLPGGKEAIVADGGKIFHIDLTTNNEVKTWSTPTGGGGFAALAVANDGKHVVTAQTNGKMYWWDVAKNDFDLIMDASEMPLDCVAMANDSKTVLAGGRDGTVSAWEGPTGKMLKKWKAHPGGVAAVAFSPDGKLVASAGVDNLVKVWDRLNFAEVLTLKGHTNVPVGVSWTSDSLMLVTCSVDKTIRAWDSVTGLPLRWTHTSTEKVQALALDPKDRFVVAPLGDAGIQIVMLPAVRPDYPPRSTWVQAPQSPQPAPLEYLLETARSALREKYKADFALTSGDDQMAVYEKLMGRAKVAPDDPATRFATFREARDLAVRVGRMEEAFKAVDECARWFEIDDLAEKAAALKEAGKGTVSRPVVEAAASIVEQAEKLARPDIVDELLRQRELFPQLADAPELTARVLAAEKRWTSAANDRDLLKRLLADWMKNPEDAAANLAYGKHLCFRLGQWNDGLPRIVKGEEAALREMAKKDQASPKDGKGQAELALAWAEYSKKADEMSRPGALLRAKFWYDLASRSTDLSAGDRNSATARISEINRQVEASPNAPSNKGGVPVKRQQFNTIRNALAMETQWAFAGPEALSPEGLVLKSEGTLVSRFRVLDACQVEFAIIPDGREVTVQLNSETASFKPEKTTAIVFVIAERKGAKVTFTLKSFTGMKLDEKSANLVAGKDDASAITFKIAAAADKDGITIKSIVVQGMVRPVD